MNMVPRKIEGAGKAGRQPHPQPRVRSLIEAHERSHYRFSQQNPAFPAQWFDGLLRDLPGERNSLLSPSSAGYFPQTWHQQRVSGPHDLAVLFGVFAQCNETIAPNAKASIASRAQRFVTIAKRPSGGHETAELVEMICPTAKAKYFSLMVWTDFW